MKKVYKLNEIDCANCATKLEAKIAKIKGVSEACVNFMAQKLTVEVEDESVLDEVKAVCKKFEPDMQVIG
ncbi:MAG: cation transporter [Clostridia bacterium]|nr:cation transporter [Clostridia bacterium]